MPLESNIHVQLPVQAIQWVESILHQPILSHSALVGSTSSSVYQLITADHQEYVLRLFTFKAWLDIEPDLALHEASVLNVVSARNELTPSLIAFDEQGIHTVFPAVLMTKVSGKVDLHPTNIDHWVNQLAQTLVNIHNIKSDFDTQSFNWHYKHWYQKQDIKIPSWSYEPDAFKKLGDLLLQPAPKMPTCFLHRDYHPANVLWEDENISGVVDWVNGCIGPAMVDVSHCRLNLVCMYGHKVADKFLHAWLKLTGKTHYSLWWDINGLANGGVFHEPLSVYTGWADFGKTDITVKKISGRLDQFAKSLSLKV